MKNIIISPIPSRMSPITPKTYKNGRNNPNTNPIIIRIAPIFINVFIDFSIFYEGLPHHLYIGLHVLCNDTCARLES